MFSQKNITNQQLFWGRYAFKYTWNKGWNLRQEIEERAYLNPWRQHQLLIRSHFGKKIDDNWSSAIGFTYFVQSLPHNPFVKDYTNQVELRPQFEIAYKNKSFNDKLQFQHRNWFEFRIFEQTNNQFKYGNLRYRYLFELSYEVLPKLNVKAFDEIFLNIGKSIIYNVFDHNRYGFGFNYQFNTKWSSELLYFNWFQQQANGTDFYSRDILRLTIFHELKKK